MSETKTTSNKHGSLRKTSIILLILACLATALAIAVPFGQFFGVIVEIPLALFWMISVIFVTVITIGLVWLNSGYKNFVAGLNKFMSGTMDFFTKTLPQVYPYVAPICSIIVVAFLGVSIAAFVHNKGAKGYLARMIVAIILTVFTTAFLLAGGFIIYKW